MKTLLIPIDFSATTNRLVATALVFAKKFGSKVVLVHTVMPPPPITNDFALPVATMEEVVAIDEKSALTRLNRYVKKCRDARVKAEARVLLGPPGASILDEAKRTKADFIVMGSHGHGKLYDLFVGSTASSVLKGATCGVIVLPPKKR